MTTKRTYTPEQIAVKVERKRKWRQAHPELARAENSKWRLLHPCDSTERVRKWRAKHPERSALQNKVSRKRHPEASRWGNRQRSARERAQGEGISREQWESLMMAYKGKCAYCGEKKRLTIDHVVPLVRGGRHELGNVVPACRRCNSRKNAAVTGWEAPMRMMV